MKNQLELTRAWLSRTKAAGKSNSMFFENKIIYSYGKHYPLACLWDQSDGTTVVLVNPQPYSVTTDKHRRTVWSAVYSRRDVFKYVEAIAEDWVPLIKGDMTLDEAKQRLQEEKEARRQRSLAQRREWRKSALEHARRYRDSIIQSFLNLNSDELPKFHSNRDVLNHLITRHRGLLIELLPTTDKEIRRCPVKLQALINLHS